MAMTFRIAVPRSSGKFQAVERQAEGVSVFERVRNEVDLHKVLPPEADSREFVGDGAGYYLRHCISPDHQDTQLSMLVFKDGVKCQACGLIADTTNVYQMFHPELSKFECALALLSGDFHIDGNAKAKPKALRTLDPDLAIRNHLALAEHPDRVHQLEQQFGFSRKAIQHFRLGWARVLVPIMPHEYKDKAELERHPNIEWREREGQEPAPYQWQWRFAVPVFDQGALRQMLYRKADADALGSKIMMEYRAGTNWLFNGDVLSNVEYAVFSSGWGDVIVQWQWGVPAVSGISGDGQFKADWTQRLGVLKRRYAVTDADVAGQKLRARLTAEMPGTRFITLPYDIGTKKDVRDFHLDGHSGTEYLTLMRRADAEASFRALRRPR